MKLNVNTILIIIIILLLGVGYFVYNNLSNKLTEAQQKAKVEFLKNDELKKEAEGWYSKYVADTATVGELENLVDSLEIEVDNPRIVYVTELSPADTIKETDSIYINEGIAYIEDYYPSKDNYFLKYTNNFSLDDPVGQSEFEWSEMTITGTISQGEDGLFKFDLNTPEFITVGNIDVVATPIEPVEKDNFGILFGGGYGQDFTDGSNYIELGTGIRINKTYITIEGNTNKQADIGLKFEF